MSCLVCFNGSRLDQTLASSCSIVCWQRQCSFFFTAVSSFGTTPSAGVQKLNKYLENIWISKTYLAKIETLSFPPRCTSWSLRVRWRERGRNWLSWDDGEKVFLSFVVCLCWLNWDGGEKVFVCCCLFVCLYVYEKRMKLAELRRRRETFVCCLSLLTVVKFSFSVFVTLHQYFTWLIHPGTTMERPPNSRQRLSSLSRVKVRSFVTSEVASARFPRPWIVSKFPATCDNF